jgi:hypothetical protein
MPNAPLLLPRPRLIESLPGRARIATASSTADPSANLRFDGAEAYALHLDARNTTLLARSNAGLQHAQHTLSQIRRQYGEHGPAMHIEDAPAYPIRGVMLDVSRDRIPTMPEFRRLIDRLASIKFNHLQLYTEHTFAYGGHEEVWRGWSPITPDEARQLDRYCSAKGIELAANQNCFGHLTRWLKHPRYSPLAETHSDWVFENAHERFPRSGPFSLCPIDSGSVALIEDLLSQLLPCFSSPLVNIGCDETFDVGQGRSKAEVAQRGRSAVYFDFVHKIAAAAREHGKRPMFWADIALSDPASIPLIPEDMIGLAWGYEADAPFAEWCSRLREAGREVWVCPGTSSWRSITGRTTERRENLRRAAREGLAHNASGFLVTDWGDSGHHQQWPVAAAALAEAADAAWSCDSPGYDPRAASLHMFGDESLAIGPWLDRLGDADLPLRRIGGRRSPDQPPTALRNSSALFCDMFLPIGPGGEDKLRAGILGVPSAEVEAVLARLEALARARPGIADPLLGTELDHTLAVARFAAARALWRRRGAPTRDAALLRRDLEQVIAEHRRLWLERSREGGLEESVSYYERLRAEIPS